MFLVSPIRPQRLVQKLFFNLSALPKVRKVVLEVIILLLKNDSAGVRRLVKSLDGGGGGGEGVEDTVGDMMEVDSGSGGEQAFPPTMLIGVPPDVDHGMPWNMSRRTRNSFMAHAIAANLPTSAHGSGSEISSIVARRLVDTLWYLSKNSPNTSRELLMDGGFEQLLDLLKLDVWIKSAGNLESCLLLLDTIAAPLVALPEVFDDVGVGEKKDGGSQSQSVGEPMDVVVEEKTEVVEEKTEEESKGDDEVIEIPPEMGSNGKAAKYVFVKIPRPVISVERLRLLCGILRLEACKDSR